MTAKHLNQAELAERWRLSRRTLERWRAIGLGPSFLKIGSRVIYRQADVEAYEEQHLRTSTSNTTSQSMEGAFA